MNWQVRYSTKATKQLKKIPLTIQEIILALIMDIQRTGAIQGQWPNFGKLGERGHFHCHLKKGRLTYVACWRITDKRTRNIEVYYVGTHEKAPY